MTRRAEQTHDREPISNYVDAVRLDVPFRDDKGVVSYPTMRSRPQPTFTLDLLHRFLLVGSLVGSVCHALWIVARIPSMPAQVPMQFAADGSVNRYGSPWEILGIASVFLVTIIGLAILARYPRVYNYGVGSVTEENIQAQYKNGVQMMVWAVFSMVVLQVIALGSVAGDWSTTPAMWIGLALMLGSIAFFILRMLKL